MCTCIAACIGCILAGYSATSECVLLQAVTLYEPLPAGCGM